MLGVGAGRSCRARVGRRFFGRKRRRTLWRIRLDRIAHDWIIAQESVSWSPDWPCRRRIARHPRFFQPVPVILAPRMNEALDSSPAAPHKELRAAALHWLMEPGPPQKV